MFLALEKFQTEKQSGDTKRICIAGKSRTCSRQPISAPKMNHRFLTSNTALSVSFSRCQFCPLCWCSQRSEESSLRANTGNRSNILLIVLRLKELNHGILSNFEH